MAKATKKGLGRGLDALFEDSRQEGGEITSLSVAEIEPDPGQPRRVFEEQALQELSDSIREHGLLQPIAVRPLDSGSRYRIIAGERRWRAARMAGLTEVPVVIRDVGEDQAMELALIENLQREDLDPVEEARGIGRLMKECGLTQEDAAKKLGKSRSAVANSLRLLRLPESVLDFLAVGALTTGHAKVLLCLEQPELIEKAASEVVRQDLNVRQTESLCKQLLKEPKPPKKPARKPALVGEVELALRDVLGSEVKVDYKRGGKGTLTLHFYSDQQLKDFANLLGHYENEASQEQE